MHFIKCNRIIIFYDPDLDTCALSAVRGDGPSPVWLLVCKASELVDSSFDLPPPRGRMEAGHPGVDTVMPLSPSGFSHEPSDSAECMSPLFRRKKRETIDQKKTRETTAQPVFGRVWYCRCKDNLLCMTYETKSVCKTFSQIDATLRVESNEPN